jgi:hypothetical protein
MSKTTSRFTQADLSRAIRAAKLAGAGAVLLLLDGTIRIEIEAQPSARDGRSSATASLHRSCYPVVDGPETVPHRRRPKLEAAEARLIVSGRATVPPRRFGSLTPEQARARDGYTDESGNVRKIVAGLGAGKVRVIAPDGRKWVEDVRPTDPASCSESACSGHARWPRKNNPHPRAVVWGIGNCAIWQ